MPTDMRRLAAVWIGIILLARLATADDPIVDFASETAVSLTFSDTTELWSDAEFAALLQETESQPELTTPTDAPDPAPIRRSPRRLPSRSRYSRLSRLPNIFGDFFSIAGQVRGVLHSGPFSHDHGFLGFDLPLAGGASRLKVADNNRALPTDRIYFTHNHFHNAVEYAATDFVGFGVSRARTEANSDRFVLGAEKTFLDGDWSAEVRLPLTNRFRLLSPAGLSEVEGGNVGNFSVIVKRLLYETDTSAAVIGIGIDTPTGNEVTLTGPGTRVVFQNQAVHLAPYVGIATTPSPRMFFQGFMQCDVPTNGNRIDIEDPLGLVPGVSAGSYDEQVLFALDVAAGYWLYDCPEADYFQGLAAIVEYHYTTTLDDTDSVDFFGFRLTNDFNRVDASNLTIGLEAKVAKTSFRVATTLPLTNEENRQFDAEIIVQVNRQF
jgi:hypothetical protein